ncbi:uncharacterized protein LOC120339267 [Styela clava]
MEMHALLLSILLLTILTGSDAKSFDQPNVCAEKCLPGRRSFFENDGYEYSYSYRTVIESSFHTDSLSDQKAQTSIEVPFTIQAVSDCDLVLQIQRGIYIDNGIPRTDEELDWQEAIVAYPLHFSWQDGLIENICPTTNEPNWVLNFKRGILSAMQITSRTSASGVKEIDVSGNCEADYFVQGEGTTMIKKTKDYTQCENRDKHLFFSWATPYEISSPRQSFIHSMQTCDQTLTNVLQGVTCTEEHVFRPFSTDEGGARTHITQEIRYLRQRRISRSSIPRSSLRRTTLAYEEDLETVERNMAESTQSAKNLMDGLCANMQTEDYQEVSKQFMSLVFAMRKLDFDSLSELHSYISECANWHSTLREMFDDALPFCGTDGCVKYASNLILNNELNKKIAERWLTGFSFIKEPTAEMISSLLDVVESKKIPERSFLTVGSMIHQYCEISEENCMNNNAIRQTIEILMQHLGTNCHSPNPETRKLIIYALRAIGNAGQTTEQSVLRRCIFENDNSMEIRIAAIEAHRRMPCSVDRSALMTTLRNEDADSEIRIAAYKGLMQCPTFELVKDVKDILEIEQNMQVGSYIWSHLTQVQDSQDPLKHILQAALVGHTFKEFSLDPRKYSKYYEGSMFSEKFNSGATADASLVWSPKSFIPRSASVNLTVDVFGQAINLFEFGGRIQGFESYLQSFLEPKAFEKRQEKKNLQSGRKTNPLDEAQASWFMRVVGNEVLYGNTEMMPRMEELESSNFLVEFASKFMSDEGYNYHDDSLLLNTFNSLPTGIGMPLQIAFNGTTSVDINAAGKFNMGFGASPEYLIKGKVSPRAAVTISSWIVVDTHVKKTGIATESTAYSSSSISGFVKVLNKGKNVELELDTPYNKNVLFSTSHKVLRVEGNTIEEMKTTELYPQNTFVRDCTEEFLGQRLCYTQRSVSDRYSNGAPTNWIYPVDGGIEISAYIQKMDPDLTKYTISGNSESIYEMESDSIPSEMMVQMVFDTPGSRVNRKTTVFGTYNLPKMEFSVLAQQEEKTLQLEGNYKNIDESHEATIKALWNEDTYKFNVNLDKNVDEDGSEWSANAVLQLPSKTMSAKSSMAVDPAKRLKASFVMDNVLQSPIVMKLDLQDKSRKTDKLSYSGEAKLSILPFINTEYMIDMDLKPKLDNLMLNMNYKIGGGRKESILLHHKRTSVGRKSETDWTISQMLTSSQFPSLNHKVAVSHRYVKGSTSSSIDIGYGTQLEQPNNPYKLELRQEYTDNSDSSKTDISGQFSINVPYVEMNREFQFEHLQSKEILSSKIRSVCGEEKPKQFTLIWQDNAPKSELMDNTFELGFSTAVGDWHWQDNIRERVKNVYNSKSTLSLGAEDSLKFIQESELVMKDTNMSFSLSIVKGDGSKIITGSTVNTMESETRYISKNFIHLHGYTPRGLDIIHDRVPSDGYPTTVNFLASNIVHVSVKTTYRPSENGKHMTFIVEQDDVEKRIVSAEAGYDFVDDEIDMYANLNDNGNMLFSSHIIAQTPSTESGKFSVELKEKLSPKNMDFNTTISYSMTDESKVTFFHRNEQKSVQFEVNAANNGIHGILKHNFCDYMNDATYNIALTSAGAAVTVSADGHQAHVNIIKSTNMLEMKWDHDRMPDLMNMNVPTAANMVIGRNTDETAPKKMWTTVNFEDDVVFDMSYSVEKPRSGVTKKVSMSNTLLPMIPESARWAITMDEVSLQSEAEIGEESMTFTVTTGFPESASMEFTRTAGLTSCDYIPENMKASYEYSSEPHTVNLNMEFGEKSASVETTYSPDFIKASLTMKGIDNVPKYTSIELRSQLTTSPRTIDVTGKWNDDIYIANIKHTFDYKKTSESNLPYVSYIVNHELNVDGFKNGVKVVDLDDVFEINKEQIIYDSELVQTVTDYYPRQVHKRQVLTINDKEYSYFERSIITGLDPMEMEIKYTKNKLEFSQSISKSPMVPSYLSLKMREKRGVNRIIMECTMDGKSKTSTLSYQLNDDNMEMSLEHDCEMMAEYVPKHVTASLSWAENILMSYEWGAENGQVKLWKDSITNAGVYVKLHANDITFNFTYGMENGIAYLYALVGYQDQKYVGEFCGGYVKGDDSPLFGISKVFVIAEVFVNEKRAITANTLEFHKDYLLINTTNMQDLFENLPPSYVFVKKFNWAIDDSSIEVTIEGLDDDSFLFTISASHKGFSTASIGMQHNQDWEILPKQFGVKFEKDCTDGDHSGTLTINTDSWTKAISHRLQYGNSDEGVYAKYAVNNDFSTLGGYLELPSHFSIDFGGSIGDTTLDYHLNMSYDDLRSAETMHAEKTDNGFSVTYDVKQNATSKLPGVISLKFGGSRTDTDIDWSFDLTADEKKAVEKLHGTISDTGFTLTYSLNQDVTTYYPKTASIDASGNKDKSITFDLKGTSDDKSITEHLSLDNVKLSENFNFKYTLNQDMLSWYPEKISMNAVKSDGSFTGDCSTTMSPNSFTGSVKATWSDKDVSFSANFSCDENPETPYHIELKWTKNDASMFGNIEFIHNFDEIVPLPKKMGLEIEPGTNNMNILLNIDDHKRKIEMRRRQDDGAMEYNLRHNLEMLSDYNLPMDVGVSYQKSPFTSSLKWGSSSLGARYEPEQNLLNVDVSVAEVQGKISLQKTMNEELTSMIFQHDLSALSEYNLPNDFTFSYQLTPFTVSATWGDNEIFVMKSGQELKLRQNVFEQLPQYLVLNCNCDMSSETKLMELKGKLDSYSFYGKYHHNMVDTYTMNLIWQLMQDEDTLIDLFVDTDMILSAGHLNTTFTQSLTDSVYDHFSFYTKFNIQETSGTVSVATNIEEPIDFVITYSKVTDYQYNVVITHNVESIVDTLPLETSGTLTMTWTEPKKGIDVTVVSADRRKSFSFNILSDMGEDSKQITLVMSHDFDMLESELSVPKSASFKIKKTSNSGDISLTYNLDSTEKEATIDIDFSDSMIRFNVDQNILEPASRSRKATFDIPQKVLILLNKDSDVGRYRSKMSFKSGQKRRYFNAELNTDDNAWDVSLSHNLNRVLPVKLPSNMKFEVNWNASAIDLALKLDDNDYAFTFWRVAESSKVGSSFTHNDHSLVSKGVPQTASMVLSKDSNADGDFVSAVYSANGHSSATVSITRAAKKISMIFNSEGDSFTISSNIVAMLRDNGVSFGVTGTQTGLEEFLAENFEIHSSASYAKSESMLSTSFSHNIPMLKDYGLPYQANFEMKIPVFTAEGTLKIGFSVEIDDLVFSENSINLDVKYTASSIEINANGMRTRNLWSTTSSDKLAYDGTWKVEVTTESDLQKFDLLYTLRETDTNNQVVRDHNSNVVLTVQPDSIEWELRSNAFVDEQMTSTGTATRNDGTYTLKLAINQGTNIDYSGKLQILTGEIFEIHYSDEERNTFNIVVNKDSAEQFVLSHNIEMITFIPESIITSLDIEEQTFSMKVTENSNKIVLLVKPSYIELTRTSPDMQPLFVLKSEYVSHPSHKVTSEFKIPELSIDYSSAVEVHFFKPGDGRSLINIDIKDNANEKSFTVNSHAFLQDRDISDLNIVANIDTDMTMIPFNFAFEYILQNSPYNFRMHLKMREYSFTTTNAERSFETTITLPKSIRIYKLSVSGDCVEVRNGNEKSTISVQWNDDQTISLSTVSNFESDSHLFNFDIRQPFIEPDQLSGSYTFEKSGRWNVVNIEMTDNTNPFTVMAKYSDSKDNTHEVVVDVAQPYDHDYIPKHSVTTGTILYTDTVYNSDWKITANNKDIVTFKKLFQSNSDGYHFDLHWRQPYEELFLTSLDISHDIRETDNGMEVIADISHSGDDTYIPSHFVATQTTTKTDTLYQKINKVVSEGQELASLKQTFKVLNDGYQVSVSLRQPHAEFGPTYFDTTADLKLGSNGMSLNVDVEQPYDNIYIPKEFTSKHIIKYNQGMYDSDFKIISNGEELVVLKKYFEATASGYTAYLHWKQPYEEFGATSFDTTFDYKLTTSSKTLNSDISVNDQSKLAVEYSWNQPNSNSQNTSVAVIVDGKRYESKWHMSTTESQVSGKKCTFVYDNQMPKLGFLPPFVPTQQHFSLTTFRKDANAHFTTVYSSNLIKNPVQIEGMYILHTGNKLFDSMLSFKSGPESSALADAEVQFTVDNVEGVTMSAVIPPMGFDRVANVKYDQKKMIVSMKYIVDGKQPVVVSVNLKQIIPKLNAILDILKNKELLPKIKIIGDFEQASSAFSGYIGIQVRNTPYTIHLETGFEDEKFYFNVTTKRQFRKLDDVLSITAYSIDAQNVQVQIITSEKLGRMLTMVTASCHAEMKDKVVMATDTIIELLSSLDSVVQGSEMVQDFINKYKNVAITYVNAVKVTLINMIDNANTLTRGTLLMTEETVGYGLTTLIKIISTQIEKLRDFVSQPLQQIKDDYLLQVSTEIYNWVQPKLQPLTDKLNQVHAGQLLLELVQEGITKTIFVMEKNVEAILTASRQPLAKMVELSENKVVINIPLHIPVKGLIAPPSIADISLWIAESSLAHELDTKLKILYKAVDLYYQYRSILNMPLEEIIPPFKGHAELSGFRHFHTFDGKRYDFASRCDSKHILLHDFADNEFQIYVTYGKNPSLTVTSYDPSGRQQSVVMRRDYSITDENGHDIPMPMGYADVSVKRTGEFVTLKTVYGLVVSCNFVSDLCTIDISPFYFAGVSGMLGTFNNEINDDFTGPRSSEINDFEQLAQAWMIPGTCNGANMEAECTQTASDACTQLFEGRTSKFFSCFSVEDPEPYKKMCIRDTCSSSSAGICTAAASYARRCALRGVILPTPESCKKCISARGDAFSNGQVQVTGADVVFVIEKSGCIRFKKKDYKRFLGKLHKTLNETVATGNLKYAVVGFGGPEGYAEPHTIPFDNEIFMRTDIVMAPADERALISAFRLKETRGSEPATPDVMQAISYASQLPFRAGAARTIILVTCDECGAESMVDKSNVQAVLQEQGIIIHHLRQKNIQAGKGSKKVYGFNPTEIFAKNDANYARSELKVSSTDQCLPLVDMTGGSVWNSNTFGRESLQNIVNQVSTGINSATRQECVCSIADNGSATSKCIAS